MNQDSEKNDRRDGDPQQRPGRSFGRRDDDRQDTPRFSRAGSNRSSESDRLSRDGNSAPRPGFSRDRNSDSPSGRFGDSRPRFDSNSSADKPRFDRDRNNGGDKPRFERDRNSSADKPRFERKRDANSTGRGPSGPRPDRSSDSNARPRFDRSGGSEQRRSFGDRNDDRRKDGPARFGRDTDRPERSNDRFGSERRFADRNKDQDRSGTDRPRSNRDDRTGPGARPGNDRFGNDSPRRADRSPDRNENSRPAFNRESYPRDRNRTSDGDRPRFNRDDKPQGSSRLPGERKRTGAPAFRSDKPGFKRVGGFSRDADERNRFGDDQGNGPRPKTRTDFSEKSRNRHSDSPEPSRFSPAQRKESGDRRTGNYEKAPNYDLDNSHGKGSFSRGRNAGSRQSDKSTDNRSRNSDSSESGLTRLNRYIANSGVCSRREADELIARGDISVNGKVVTEMGYKVKEGDTVKYGTKALNPERFVYVLLNKPKDYITTTDDPEERKTVMELVADAGNFRMYPVGRLDRNTTGLLLLTNDGEVADKLTHPSNNVRKIYQVELDKPITTEHFEALKKGIELEDGPIKPDAISIVTPDAYVVGIEIHSGRNRIVRRMFEHFGYEVSKLDRTTYAGLTKKELPRGKWRFLDPKEVVKLKYFNS